MPLNKILAQSDSIIQTPDTLIINDKNLVLKPITYDSINENNLGIENQLNKFKKKKNDSINSKQLKREEYTSITEHCKTAEDTLLYNIHILETSDFNRYLKGKVRTNTVNFYMAEKKDNEFTTTHLLGKEIYKMNELGQEIEVNTYSESDETPFKVVKNEYKDGIQNKVNTYIDGELQKSEELIFKDNQSLCYKSKADAHREEYGVIANSQMPNKIIRADVEYTFEDGKLMTREKYNKNGEVNLINKYFYNNSHLIRMEESALNDNLRTINFEYLSKDDKGNWTKCYLTNIQNGEIQHQLIITRELEYY